MRHINGASGRLSERVPVPPARGPTISNRLRSAPGRPRRGARLRVSRTRWTLLQAPRAARMEPGRSKARDRGPSEARTAPVPGGNTGAQRPWHLEWTHRLPPCRIRPSSGLAAADPLQPGPTRTMRMGESLPNGINRYRFVLIRTRRRSNCNGLCPSVWLSPPSMDAQPSRRGLITSRFQFWIGGISTPSPRSSERSVGTSRKRRDERPAARAPSTFSARSSMKTHEAGSDPAASAHA